MVLDDADFLNENMIKKLKIDGDAVFVGSTITSINIVCSQIINKHHKHRVARVSSEMIRPEDSTRSGSAVRVSAESFGSWCSQRRAKKEGTRARQTKGKVGKSELHFRESVLACLNT